jgi:hypothetical protein
MVKSLTGERWKKISFYRNTKGQHYAISGFGRLVCFTEKIKNGNILRCSLQEGYPIWRYRKIKRNGEIIYNAHLLHRLVAEYFLPKPTNGKTVVVHLNHKKLDNRATNLKWATQEEAIIHQQGSPAVKRYKKFRKLNPSMANSKLTEVKVKQVKKMLQQNKTLKSIAEKFGISDMQVHRIKIGENWKHVRV